MDTKQRLIVATSALVIAVGFYGRPATAIAAGSGPCNWGTWTGCEVGFGDCPGDIDPYQICNGSWLAYGCSPDNSSVYSTSDCEDVPDCWNPQTGIDMGDGWGAECTATQKM